MAVHLYLRGMTVPVYFSAGSVIDPEILIEEHNRYPSIPIFIHPGAAVISLADKESERDPSGSIFKVAGTRSGTGAAIARKINRDIGATYFNYSERLFPYYERIVDTAFHPYFMEISQGFSLGLNDPRFYPRVTSRECTFVQGMADARIPATSYKRGYLCLRTYPIRVGNADGYTSGIWYPDQYEMEWDEIGVPAEYTTVTNRKRRVACWSWQQFRDAIDANEPTHVFLNFMNYMDNESRESFIKRVQEAQHERHFEIIYGFNSRAEGVVYQNSPGAASLRT
jgi:adenylosuccinate synthase